jgi:hypothetical protein
MKVDPAPIPSSQTTIQQPGISFKSEQIGFLYTTPSAVGQLGVVVHRKPIVKSERFYRFQALIVKVPLTTVCSDLLVPTKTRPR